MAFMTTSTAMVQLLAGAEYRGRVLAIQAMVFLGSTPIGGPTIGWISQTLGPRAGIAIGAIACLAAAGYGARNLKAGVDIKAIAAAESCPAKSDPQYRERLDGEFQQLVRGVRP